MRRMLSWVILFAVLTTAFHVIAIWYLPRFYTSRAVDQIYRRRGRNQWTVNQFGHGNLRFAGTDIVVRDNPDTVTSFATYDLMKGPVRIHCVLPDTDNYWSLSLFDWNTDNFYVVNDRTAGMREFDVILVRSESDYQRSGEERVVVCPSASGVALIRMIVRDRNDAGELARLKVMQQKTTMNQL